MAHAHEDIEAHRYYWEYVKRFGKESYEGFKRDFVISIIVAVVSAAIRLGDRGVWDATIVFLEATAIVFACFAIYHLFHVALLIFRERLHSENGGIRYVSKGYGVLGIGLLAAMVCGVAYTSYVLLLRRLPSLVVTLPKPVQPPEIEITRPDHNPTSTNLHSQAVTSQSASPSPATQNAPPPQTAQQPLPVTWLDRMVQENRGLTSFDREKLAQQLFAADKLLKQSQGVGYKVSNEFTKISNDRQTGALAKNVEDHIKALKDLEPAVNEQYNALMKFQTDSQYFEHQTEYILGDNPFNAGEALMNNALSGMETDLTRWSKVSNRDQVDVLALVADFQSQYQEKLGGFFKWANLSLLRCGQMRESLDPNRTVDPLPTGTVAPATAMFSINRT
jgi:hypothetical protein